MIRTALVVLAVAACAPSPYRGAVGAPPPSENRYLSNEELAAIPNVFPATLVPPRSPAIVPLHARLAELRNPERLGQLVSTLISLGSRRVPIVVEECGEVDAHYNPRTQRIRICYEMVATANRLAGKPRPDWYVLDRDAASVLIFIALHEIGHALVDLLDLRFRGSEEDLADQFAFLLMTNINDVDFAKRLVRSPAAFFYHHGVEVEANGGHSKTDVHSPSKDRAFEALCLLYGRHRDANIGRALGTDAATCVDHAAGVIDTWNRLLAPHTRVDSGRTF